MTVPPLSSPHVVSRKHEQTTAQLAKISVKSFRKLLVTYAETAQHPFGPLDLAEFRLFLEPRKVNRDKLDDDLLLVDHGVMSMSTLTLERQLVIDVAITDTFIAQVFKFPTEAVYYVKKELQKTLKVAVENQCLFIHHEDHPDSPELLDDKPIGEYAPRWL